MRYTSLLLSSLALCLAAGGCTRVVTAEPGPGTLAYGEKVLVDDGTCPPGQIKEVTGENEAQTIPRKVECVEDKR